MNLRMVDILLAFVIVITLGAYLLSCRAAITRDAYRTSHLREEIISVRKDIARLENQWIGATEESRLRKLMEKQGLKLTKQESWNVAPDIGKARRGLVFQPAR